MKKILSVLMGLVLASGVVGGVSAQEVPGELLFEPESVSVEANQTFETKLILNTNGNQVGGFGAKIQYDPQFLKADSVEAGTTFPDYPSKTINAEVGLVDISAIVRSADQLFQGQDTVATIKWTALKGGKTEIKFNYQPGATDDSNIAVLFGNGDILGKVNTVAVTIGGGQDLSNSDNKQIGLFTSANESGSFSSSDRMLFLLIVAIGLINMGMIAFIFWKVNQKIAALKGGKPTNPDIIHKVRDDFQEKNQK